MKILGKVKEIFLPDDAPLTKVGFKVQTNNEIITIIKDQTLENAKIYRDDFVYIERIDENTYNIESFNNEVGDDYE